MRYVQSPYAVYWVTHCPPSAAFTSRCTSITLHDPSLLMSPVPQVILPIAWFTQTWTSETSVAPLLFTSHALMDGVAPETIAPRSQAPVRCFFAGFGHVAVLMTPTSHDCPAGPAPRLVPAPTSIEPGF